MNTPNRDISIDFIKGIAILNVIIIHTVWWSGDFYINRYSILRQAPLLFDVFVFFIVAGMLSTIKQRMTLTGLISKLSKQYIIYLIVILIWIIIAKLSSVALDPIEILEAFSLFLFTNSPGVEGLASTIWFMKIYFIIQIIIYCLQKVKMKSIILTITVAITYLFHFFSSTTTSYDAISSKVNVISFYYSLVVIGQIIQSKTIILKKNIIVLVVLLLFLISIAILFGVNDIQTEKFPPSLLYFTICLPAIGFIFIMKNSAYVVNIREQKIYKLITWAGKNSIYLFYAQSFSGSLITYNIGGLARVLNNNLITILLVSLLINFSLSILGAFILKVIVTRTFIAK